MHKLLTPLVGFTCLAMGFAMGMASRNMALSRHFLDWLPGDVSASQERGDEIVDALDAFHRANGVYPVGLYELTPEYLDSVPSPVAGDRFWRYTTDRAGSFFSLSFAFDFYEYPVCTFRSADRGWRQDT